MIACRFFVNRMFCPPSRNSGGGPGFLAINQYQSGNDKVNLGALLVIHFFDPTRASING
jgi:hypothetical protein